MPKTNSKTIALCGLMVALSVAILFFTGLFPFATFALPAIAGILLIALAVEFDYKTALIAYIGVAILSLFITPDKEAALLFVVFFGYYPIVKGNIEKLNKRILEWMIKFAIFNISIILLYASLLYLFQMPEITAEFAEYSSLFLMGLLALGNVTFLMYDIACTRMITTYIRFIRPKVLKRF